MIWTTNYKESGTVSVALQGEDADGDVTSVVMCDRVYHAYNTIRRDTLTL